jgi:hypothetical protein
MRHALTGILLLAATTSACLFPEAVIPGSPRPLDARLFGSWRCVSPESAETMNLDIAAGADQHYKAAFWAPGENPSGFSAYAADLEGSSLLNVQDVTDKAKPGEWTVLRYTLPRPGLLHLEAVHDAPFKSATNSAERLAILKNGLANSAVLDDYCSCVRIRKAQS